MQKNEETSLVCEKIKIKKKTKNEKTLFVFFFIHFCKVANMQTMYIGK